MLGHEEREEALERLYRRLERDRLRREEQVVLRRYFQADEADRQTIVAKYKEVFARLKENRRRAAAVAKAERAAVDRYLLAQGYLIRPGGGCPRYVRPNWHGVISTIVHPDGRSNDLPV
jgi:hypothetical protein